VRIVFAGNRAGQFSSDRQDIQPIGVDDQRRQAVGLC
jgi:hypothetical protein